MRVILRCCALVFSGVMLFMGIETLLPQYPNLLGKSTAIVSIIVGVFFGYYGVTGRSSFRK